MSNWISITIGTLKDRKLAPLIESMQEAALADGQEDPTPEIIQSCVNRIRTEIASCPNNRLEDDETKIPKGMLDLVCRMIVRGLKDRLEIELTKTEETAWDKDDDYLKRVAGCKIAVDSPDTPVPAQVEARVAIQVVTSSDRKFTRRSMDGL